MGAWGRSLFSNDFTCDVRDTYLEKIRESLDNEKAISETIEEYHECLDTDEEPLFWYALAETLWKVGRLTDEVKSEALAWIEKEGGIEFWEDNKKDCEKWRNTLQKLSNLLNEPMPEEKKFRKTKSYVKNPWNVGDIYAYQFHKKDAIKYGLLGKYLILQKIGDVEGYDEYYSIIQAFDKMFDEVPSINDLENLNILLQAYPELYAIHKPEYEYLDKINFSTAFVPLSSRSYPKKYLTFIGNAENNHKGSVPDYYEFENTCWENIELNFGGYYKEWENYKYEIHEEDVIVMKK